jgi:proline iminopeptidase
MAFAPVNGTQLFYTTVGKGLPCLVMHGGLGFDHTYLCPHLSPLGDTLHLVCYDHRGNGRSERPGRETMTHAQFAADADALAQYLGWNRVVVIGHSYGGFLALEMAVRYPQRLSRLILVDTAPASPSRYADEIMRAARRQGATREMLAILQEEDPTDDASMRRQLRAVWPLYWRTSRSELSRYLMDKCIISVAGLARQGELQAFDMTPRLGEIEIPTLILVGRYDFIAPPCQAERLHTGIAHSELVVFGESGHFPFAEEAKSSAAAYGAGLARHPKGVPRRCTNRLLKSTRSETAIC